MGQRLRTRAGTDLPLSPNWSLRMNNDGVNRPGEHALVHESRATCHRQTNVGFWGWPGSMWLDLMQEPVPTRFQSS